MLLSAALGAADHNALQPNAQQEGAAATAKPKPKERRQMPPGRAPSPGQSPGSQTCSGDSQKSGSSNRSSKVSCASSSACTAQAVGGATARQPMQARRDEIEMLLDALDEKNGIDGFEEMRQLGRGTFGSAVLMRSRASGLLMVTKKLPIGLNPTEMRTLENEVRACARLRHPNIVHYLATYVREDKLLICLEHAAGGTLSERLDARLEMQRPLALAVAARWISQIASAVDYMHSMAVLHRDLSANNVLLSAAEPAEHGDIKVSDFGLSKASSKSRSAITAKTVVGTPDCFSPELINGETYGAPSDAWAVGLLAHEIATLGHPFEHDSLAALLKQILACEYDEARLARAPYPEELRWIASREGLLHPDAAKRLTLKALLAMPLFSPYACSALAAAP